MRRTARDSGYSTGVTASGFYYAEVVEVNGDLLSIKIPKLMLEHVYTEVPYTGFTPAPGDLVWATFIEGNAGSPVAITGANDVESDITEIVAGTNLNGGGTSGVVTLNLNDSLSLNGTLDVYGVSTFNASASIDGDLDVNGTINATHINAQIDGPVVIPVKNTSGSVIPEGSAVYGTGAVGDSGIITIAPSLATTNTASTMPALAVTQTTLNHNAQGHAVLLGSVDGLDTSAWSLNQVLYVSPSVAGALTAIKPSTSVDFLVQPIGRVSRVNANTGEIFITGTGVTNDVPNSFDIIGGASIGGNLAVGSSSIVLNNNLATSAAPSVNAGLQVKRGTSPNASFYWDETADMWSTGNSPVSASIFQASAFNGSSAGLSGTVSAAAFNGSSAGLSGTVSAAYLTGASATLSGTLSAANMYVGTAVGPVGNISAAYLTGASATLSGTLSAANMYVGTAVGAVGSLSAGYLSSTSAMISGSASAGNLTLTDGTYDMTVTQSTDNWSLLNKQNDNGIILYGSAVSGVALRANSATVLQATSAAIFLSKNTSVSGSVSITGATRVTSSGQVSVGGVSHAFEVGTGTLTGYGIMMSPSAIQAKNGASVAPLEINKSGGAVRANGYPVAPIYSIEGAPFATPQPVTGDSPGFKFAVGRQSVMFNNGYGAVSFPTPFPTGILCCIATAEVDYFFLNHKPDSGAQSNASQAIFLAYQVAVPGTGENAGSVTAGGRAQGPLVVNYIAVGF